TTAPAERAAAKAGIPARRLSVVHAVLYVHRVRAAHPGLPVDAGRRMEMSAQHWVFGYGSLMWRPGFDYEERREAVLYGAHRRLCIYSHFHRGTPERPGLVLGLDRGGSCRGIAYRVAAADYTAVLDYLRGREQVTGVYREVTRRVRL